MNQTIAAQLLATLTKSEKTKLGKFLHSPYFNHREDLISLYHLLTKEEIESASKNGQLSKKEIWKLLYQDRPFDALQLNRVVNLLADCIERFMALEELGKQPEQEHLLRCQSFRQRGLHEHFERNLRQALTRHQASPYRNAAHWFLEYQLRNEQAAHELALKRKNPVFLTEMFEAFSHYVSLETLHWACAVQSLQSVGGQPVSVPFLNQVLTQSEKAREMLRPEIGLLRENYLAIKNPDTTEHFQALKHLLQEHASRFPPTEARDLFMSGINFCIRRHNRGERDYTREALDLYRQALQNGALLDSGILPTYTYNNIHTLARTLGELEWAKNFLDSYKDLLPENARENTYRYNLAAYHFRRGAFSMVLTLLQQVEFTEVFMQAEARKMLVISYFELCEWLSLASALDSFGTWLDRQKTLGYHRQNYLNLLRFIKKMARWGGTLSTKQSNLLQMKIEQTPYLAEREWLMEKLGLSAS